MHIQLDTNIRRRLACDLYGIQAPLFGEEYQECTNMLLTAVCIIDSRQRTIYSGLFPLIRLPSPALKLDKTTSLRHIGHVLDLFNNHGSTHPG